jgi:hypothetical protein
LKSLIAVVLQIVEADLIFVELVAILIARSCGSRCEQAACLTAVEWR